MIAVDFIIVAIVIGIVVTIVIRIYVCLFLRIAWLYTNTILRTLYTVHYATYNVQCTTYTVRQGIDG